MFKKFLLISILVLLVVPTFVYAIDIPGWPLVPCGLSQDNPATSINEKKSCGRCDLFQLLKNLIDFVVGGLMPPLAVLLFVWAGFLILLSGANPGLYAQGQTIFKTTFYGIIILLSAWMITNTLILSIGAKYNTAGNWWQFTCTETAPVSPPPITVPPPGPISTACNQNFGLTPASGCSGSACVNASSLTSTRGCESNGGVCLLSSQAFEQAQKFVASFNNLSAGQCSLRLSSTIQGEGGPSVSQCHKSGNSKSGTCADFNLLPSHDSCYQKFYQAARDSGAVASFLDEYVQACKPANATGGNIHVNF